MLERLEHLYIDDVVCNCGLRNFKSGDEYHYQDKSIQSEAHNLSSFS